MFDIKIEVGNRKWHFNCY